MKPRVMFYVQHLLGIGHLARASLICAGLVEHKFDVKMVMGGAPVAGFPGPGVEVEYLPVLKAGSFQFNDLTDENGTIASQQYLDDRRDRLLSLFAAYQPDILIVEAFPFGRRQMRFELIPLLEAAKSADWKPLVVGSVRDIIQEKKQPKRLRETVDTLNKYYDLLMVHGDPNFIKLSETFELAPQIEHLIQYTGIISADIPPLTGPAYDVIVSAGGGAAGELIMLNAMQARPLTHLADANWCFITGPNLSESVRVQLQENRSDKVTVETHRTDFRALLAQAQLSISQAGYNTAADILRARCSSVLVPFSSGGETEQSRRAAKLTKLGIVASISEVGLTPERLAEVINNALAGSQHARPDIEIALDGANRTAILLLKLLNNSDSFD
ncbi:FIG00989085: hypothetical protein [hydrothermal vent metagenome]|uniref:Glycosyl transferase family 28 C-terminal domain-containing protein n=1 Tax=hydrothermal vent metagenome TaxID=652676 RepID=A0A3B0RYK4_9ZZZZ